MSPGQALIKGLMDPARWTPPRLEFSPDQERRYIQATRASRLTHFMRSGWIALICYNLFVFSDRLMVPDVFDQALHVRLLVFTPVALFMLALGSWGRSWMLRLPDAVTEIFVGFSGVMAALSLVYILALSQSDVALLYRTGLVPILVYGNLVQRFRFRWAVCFTVAVLLVYGVGYFAHAGDHGPYDVFELSQFLFVVAIGGYTLVVNYRIELEDRRRFDRSERAAQARARLEASQQELDALSRRDALTGVPNRRHLDEYLAQQWQATRNQGQAFSVMLLDVDHFKDFNDRYGHPAGDQCLQHVAQALMKAVGPVRGLLARWGGEEFVVVLPHTGASVALQVAENLRATVEALCLRHEVSANGVVTISAGVATAAVDADPASLERLLSMADGALYQAKAAGRNAVRSAAGYNALE